MRNTLLFVLLLAGCGRPAPLPDQTSANIAERLNYLLVAKDITINAPHPHPIVDSVPMWAQLEDVGHITTSPYHNWRVLYVCEVECNFNLQTALECLADKVAEVVRRKGYLRFAPFESVKDATQYTFNNVIVQDITRTAPKQYSDESVTFRILRVSVRVK